MAYKEPWDLLSDKTIWEYLSDCKQNLSDDYIRMLFIELFSRIRRLEQENYTLKVILFESDLVDESLFNDALGAVREFLKERDEQKAREASVFAGSGISFADWVNFTVNGKFENN